MRIVSFFVALLITIGLIFCLNKKWGSIPPIGRLLSPQQGFWQNAEPVDNDYSENISLPILGDSSTVYFDEGLVPHIFSQNETDACFLQGYLHAKFRLFQMELQTLAAAGRASEIAGPGAINFDKEKRRLGMVYAAENGLRAMEADSITKAVLDAYTAGVNAYINSLGESSLPLEYKILDFKPEQWSNLKTALLLKMMAEMLASATENDLALTNAKSIYSLEQLNLFNPQIVDSLVPIIPKGTPFAKPAKRPVMPATADSLYFKNIVPAITRAALRPDRDNGSNNWAVGGSKTASGAPILCNDPHIELSLPAIWYQMQITTPQSNTYGVTLPGSPLIIIGFNDSIAWGVTNAQRDVKDYYKIQFKDESKTEYMFNGSWQPTTRRIEQIKVRGGAVVYDTVAYTSFGPVMYDASFTTGGAASENLAVRWIAHDESNEALALYYLNRAKNYQDFTTAITHFQCPAQNFVFASKSGDIAIWQQGRFPLRWPMQGLFTMPGSDSSYMWQGYIPQQENPHVINPAQGFVFSANQRPVDATYPYFIPGDYINDRATRVNEVLSQNKLFDVEAMQQLQTDYFNCSAQDMVPVMLKNVDREKLTPSEQSYVDKLAQWNQYASPDAEGQTIYQAWFDSLANIVFDEMNVFATNKFEPDYRILIELMIRDTANAVYDMVGTAEKESNRDCITQALKTASVALKKLESDSKLGWGNYKSFTIYHLLKPLKAFARQNMLLGGYGNIINAIKHSHGPSWRMIVELGPATKAYGIYPAGQSGNPGSKYFDNFVDTWAKGEYLPLLVLQPGDADKAKWKITVNKTKI